MRYKCAKQCEFMLNLTVCVNFSVKNHQSLKKKSKFASTMYVKMTIAKMSDTVAPRTDCSMRPSRTTTVFGLPSLSNNLQVIRI